MHKRSLAVLLVLPVLAACAPELEARLNASAITAALAGDVAEAQAFLRIPHGSDDNCRQDLPQMSATFARFMPITDEGQCIRIEGDSYAQFQTLIPVHLDDAGPDGETLFDLAIEPLADGLGHALSIRLLRPIAELTDAMTVATGNFAVAPSFDDHPRFLLTITNDLASELTLTGHHVFVDLEPVLGETVTIDPETSIAVRLSDVASTALAEAGVYTFATIEAGLR